MVHFFKKENMLNTIFFSALLIMVIVKTIVNSESIKEITFVISILLLAWSTININISVLERINDELTSELEIMEEHSKRYVDLCKVFPEKIQKRLSSASPYFVLQHCSKNEIETLNFRCDKDKNAITEYWQYAKRRQNIRKTRRGFIILSCVVMVFILAYLFLANDINPYLPISNYDFTIWSLIIVFFEFTIKKPITETLVDKAIKIKAESNK